MNKADLINAVAEKTGLSKKDSESAVAAVVDVITEALKQGDKVQLVGGGSFEVKSRAARFQGSCIQGGQGLEGHCCSIKNHSHLHSEVGIPIGGSLCDWTNG